MNFIQNILGSIVPAYKRNLEAQAVNRLMKALILRLPDDYQDLKDQLPQIEFLGIKKWEEHPDFLYLPLLVRGEAIHDISEDGVDYILSGIQIYSANAGKLLPVKLLFRDNLPEGLQIGNNSFHPDELDLESVQLNDFQEQTLDLRPVKLKQILAGLPVTLREQIEPGCSEELELEGKFYYSILDLEDGNCIAVDDHYHLYSLVHDAKPPVFEMEMELEDFAELLSSGKFDPESHLETRYTP